MRAIWHALHAKLIGETTRLDHHYRFRRLAGFHLTLAPFTDVAALLDHQRRNPVPHEAKDGVLRALINAAQDSAVEPEAAQTVLLLALWPGLDAIRGRLARYRRLDAGDLAGDILGRTIDAAVRMNTSRVTRVAATLLRNVERDLRRDGRAAAVCCALSMAIDEDDPDDARAALSADLPGPEDALDARRLPDRLQRLVGADAQLVLAVAVAGFTQAEAATVLGIGHDAARKRYQRAAARLATAWRDSARSVSHRGVADGFSPLFGRSEGRRPGRCR